MVACVGWIVGVLCVRLVVSEHTASSVPGGMAVPEPERKYSEFMLTSINKYILNRPIFISRC